MNTDYFKQKIEAELAVVERELQSVGRKNPKNSRDWEAIPGTLDTSSADENSAADRIEEYEDNTAILKQLEIRYNELKDALVRIKSNTYGTCEVSGHKIETERLEANPAARTCTLHMDGHKER